MDMPNRFLTTADENLTSLSGPSAGFVATHNVSSADAQPEPDSYQPHAATSAPASNSSALPSYIDNFPPLSQNGFHQEATANQTNGSVYASVLGTKPAVDNAQSQSPMGGGSPFSGSSESLPTGLQTITQLFTIPHDERNFVGDGENAVSEQQRRICRQVQSDFGVVAEFTSHKDKSLCVMLSGRMEAVKKARRALLGQLTRQQQKSISIPKQFHGAILGRGAMRLREIESETATKITIPPQQSQEETIVISGPRDGIETAKHRLQLIAAEQAKIGFERVNVPKMYHPFICGPYNRRIEEWTRQYPGTESGATTLRVHVPPPALDNDEIVISGDRTGVEAVRDSIYRIMEEKKSSLTKLEVAIDKAKHKYIIGPRGRGIQEMLEQFDVSVEVPPLDSPSNSITLRGSSRRLGEAVSAVYHKAEAYQLCTIQAPNWIHKYLIGKDGSNIQALTAGNSAKVHVEFADDSIVVDGQAEAMGVVRAKLTEQVDTLLSTLSFKELTVDSRHHKHIVGKSGANLARLTRGGQVRVNVPNEMDGSNIIRVEGDIKLVPEVLVELQALITRVENEKMAEVKIEQRLHRLLIGTGGEQINKVRAMFPDTSINFPDNAKTRSDFVTLRGPKDQVEKCTNHLKKLAKDLSENNYEGCVSVLRKFHKNIIGKEGSTINMIRKETNTRIEMPSPNLSNDDPAGDVISIIGRKENVDKAKKKILELESQLANIVERWVEIPAKVHRPLIGRAGVGIKALVAQAGDVTVHFPAQTQEGHSNNKVQIRGDKRHVDKAVQLLMEEAHKMAGEACEEIKVAQGLHRFLIGRDGASVRRLQSETGARVIFDQGSDIVTILGSQKAVNAAKSELQSRVKRLESTVELDVNIASNLHRHFLQNNRRVLNQILDACGSNSSMVVVSFPPQAQQGNEQTQAPVRVKGPEDMAVQVKERLLQSADDLLHQTHDYMDIEPRYHRTVLGRQGFNVQQVESECRVRVKFPDLGGATQGPPRRDQPGIGPEVPPPQPHQVLIIGRAEQIAIAKERLAELVPVEKTLAVAREFHRSLIGQNGQNLRGVQSTHNVHIGFPRMQGPPPGAAQGEAAADAEGDLVTVTGNPANVDKAIEALKEQIEELEKQKADNAARQFTLKFFVDPKYYNKLIGMKGANIMKLRQKHDVNINLPPRNQTGDAAGTISLVGYEAQCEACKADIESQVEELASYITVSLRIDPRLHPRLIGTKGKALRALMNAHPGADVRFPGMNSTEPNVVTITGPGAAVEKCEEKLRSLADEMGNDMVEEDWEAQYAPPKRGDMNGTGRRRERSPAGFVMRDAPWDTPGEFPALGATAPPPGVTPAPGPQRAPTGGVWAK